MEFGAFSLEEDYGLFGYVFTMFDISFIILNLVWFVTLLWWSSPR